MISACMIVKNEQDNLGRCLSSLTPAVDEVVVVDTGSTDGTADVARQHGARVFDFEWCDDFAAARNESLRRASGDWIIWIDADDELIERSPGALKRLCEVCPSSAIGYLLRCESPRSIDGSDVGVTQQWRIARRTPGLHFRGRVHEHLMPQNEDQPAEVALQDEVLVRHHGYLPNPEKAKLRHARNQRLLELELADDPDSFFTHYNLAREHAWEGNYRTALESIERAIDIWSEAGQTPAACVGPMFSLAVAAAFDAADYEKALEFEESTPEQYHSPDLLFWAGMACWQLGRQEAATQRLERVRQGSLPTAIEGDPALSAWRAAFELSKMYVQLGQPEPARDRAREALAGMLDKPAGRRRMLEVGDDINDPALILEALSGEVAGLPEADAILIRAVAYDRLGDSKASHHVLEAGCQRFPDDARLQQALARALAGEASR